MYKTKCNIVKRVIYWLYQSKETKRERKKLIHVQFSVDNPII